MEITQKKNKKLVLVCTNRRIDGRKCCMDGGADDIRARLKEKCKERRLPVRVSSSGCLDMCDSGPAVTIQPDDVWLGGVTAADVDAIVDMLEDK